jgi:excisionase family DNA binding protein
VTVPPILDLAALAEFIRAIVREQSAALQQPQLPEWLTVPEAADYLRRSRRTMERLVAAGDVRSSVVAGGRIIRREWLDEYAATREEVAPTTPPRRRARLPYALPTTPEGGQSNAR